MAKTREWMSMTLVALLLIGSIGTGSLLYSTKTQRVEMKIDTEDYYDAVYTLKGFLGLKDDIRKRADSNETLTASEDTVCENSGMGRMTQRITVADSKGILPICGTLSKMQDVFYPGTYEVKFGNKAMLAEKATMQVKMPVDKDQQVYILTGNKQDGYKQFAVVQADDNMVSFDTTVIQNYTISTTDIIRVQDVVASVITD